MGFCDVGLFLCLFVLFLGYIYVFFFCVTILEC